MQLSLYKYTDRVEKTYFNWIPNAEQWWITGFDWRNVKPDEKLLLSVGMIRLGNYPQIAEKIVTNPSAIAFDDIILDDDCNLWMVWR